MLTDLMKEAFARVEVFPLATATPDGIPNVVPIKYLEVAGDSELWIMDNFLGKTMANLRANPEAALFVWCKEPKCCIQIKARVEIRTEGPDYEAMRARVLEAKADLPARALVVLHIREIYQCLPGPDLGQRLWPES